MSHDTFGVTECSSSSSPPRDARDALLLSLRPRARKPRSDDLSNLPETPQARQQRPVDPPRSDSTAVHDPPQIHECPIRHHSYNRRTRPRIPHTPAHTRAPSTTDGPAHPSIHPSTHPSTHPRPCRPRPPRRGAPQAPRRRRCPYPRTRRVRCRRRPPRAARPARRAA